MAGRGAWQSAQGRPRRRTGRALTLLALVLASSACRTIERDPITLERNLLTIDNHTAQDWKGVEIWVNTYYRVTKDVVPAKSRFQAPLDTFVAGYGQRFDYRRATIRDLRLTATLPDGQPFELKKQFDGRLDLSGALGGKH